MGTNKKTRVKDFFVPLVLDSIISMPFSNGKITCESIVIYRRHKVQKTYSTQIDDSVKIGNGQL